MGHHVFVRGLVADLSKEIDMGFTANDVKRGVRVGDIAYIRIVARSWSWSSRPGTSWPPRCAGGGTGSCSLLAKIR